MLSARIADSFISYSRSFIPSINSCNSTGQTVRHTVSQISIEVQNWPEMPTLQLPVVTWQYVKDPDRSTLEICVPSLTLERKTPCQNRFGKSLRVEGEKGGVGRGLIIIIVIITGGVLAAFLHDWNSKNFSCFRLQAKLVRFVLG